MERSREREERRRDDWSDREWERGRDRRREYERGRRERFSPPRHMSPQHKRVRREWEDHRADHYRGAFDLRPPFPVGPMGNPGCWQPELPQLQPHPVQIPLQARLGMVDPDVPPAPPTMRTFKDFLLNMEDNVDETEAVKRYNQYKLDFRQQQLQDFFLKHKENEWFRVKYHPEEIVARKAESLAALKSRLDVFLYLLENGWLDNVSLVMDHAPSILKLLDAAVIKMEGGTEFDLQVLEFPSQSVSDGAAPVSTANKPNSPKGPASKDHSKKSVEDEQQNGQKDERQVESGEEEEEEKGGGDESHSKKGRKRKRSRSRSADSGEGSGSESDSSQSDGERDEEEEGEEGVDECRKQCGKERKKEGETSDKPHPLPPVKPRPLHLTNSLFIRTINPDVTKEEIAALCRRFPGFLRVALSDPQPERRFLRRCWVTFDRSVNIKEICWNLQNVRLKQCDLAPVVNRDLLRRVRTVNGLSQHRAVVRSDIALSTRLVQRLDQRAALWSGEVSNPLLKNMADYLIEEVSAEEEELCGVATDEHDQDAISSQVTMETDDKMVQALDRLLLYLRVVHSVDYYNFCEYPSEDEMPHRCGLIHVRGTLPPGKLTANEVAEHQKMYQQKLSPLLSSCENISEEAALKLGKKDPELEVEKFLAANTQELGRDKWLCPLSGKKFKAPEFVRKHILNKHADKVTAVRQEVEFFNNFLLDAKRPEDKPLPPPPPQIPVQPPQQQSLLGFPPGVRPPMPGFPGPVLPSFPPNQFGRGHDNYRGVPRNTRAVRGDPRSIIEYRDLDAPDDLDFF